MGRIRLLVVALAMVTVWQALKLLGHQVAVAALAESLESALTFSPETMEAQQPRRVAVVVVLPSQAATHLAALAVLAALGFLTPSQAARLVTRAVAAVVLPTVLQETSAALAAVVRGRFLERLPLSRVRRTGVVVAAALLLALPSRAQQAVPALSLSGTRSKERQHNGSLCED